MTVFKQTVTATLVTQDGYNYPLNILNGSPVLNEGSSPYAYASITVSRPAIQVLAALDPTLSPRVRLTVSRAPGTSRTFDLLVSARQLETESARIGINLVSDEQLLQDYSLTATAPDLTFWGYQSSVRSIVYNVLNRVLGPSFSIAYGAVDKAIPTFSALKNYIPVPSFEVNSGLWAPVNVAVARSSTWAQVGTSSFQMTPNTLSSDSYAALDPGMQPGQTYSMSGYYKATAAQTGTLSTNARRMAVYVQSGTSNLRLLSVSTQAPNTTTATRVFGTFTIPENTTYSEVRVYSGAAMGGGVSYWDGLMLTEGNGMETNNITRLAYFDGDTPTTSSYSYAWDEAAGLSSSNRTPLIQRDPDFLTWTPGQTAWDFLTAILQTVGLRLFCDEARVWRLVDNDYSVPGLVHVDHGVNLYAHQDLMSRTASQNDGIPLYADAVVIKYSWRDTRLRDQVAYDRAGATNPQKAYQLERPDTAYPGPGAAAYILTRIQARKRQLAVTGATDLSVTPGQEVTVSVPRAPTQTGLVDGVSWDLNSGVMTLQTKGVVNTPANAWINRTTTWAATSGTWAQQ
jgi:hypothetical protein